MAMLNVAACATVLVSCRQLQQCPVYTYVYHCHCRVVLEVKLSYDGERLSSVLDVGGDLLIIPQACIGGKLKGKNVQ